MKLPLLLGLAYVLSACGASRVEVDEVINNGAPLVRAVRTYEADHKRAPASLEALVPRYLAAIPSTGLASDVSREYRYTVDDRPPYAWKLSVRMESLGFKHMRYDPSRRFELPVRELRDGWVMVTP
jgi:hypothetical protein